MRNLFPWVFVLIALTAAGISEMVSIRVTPSELLPLHGLMMSGEDICSSAMIRIILAEIAAQ
jgi:hypothetical protein